MMLTMGDCARIALCRLDSAVGQARSQVQQGRGRAVGHARITVRGSGEDPSNRPSTQRMPPARSSAATKCSSEVPGLAKQTSIPFRVIAASRLSAPFTEKSPSA